MLPTMNCKRCFKVILIKSFRFFVTTVLLTLSHKVELFVHTFARLFGALSHGLVISFARRSFFSRLDGLFGGSLLVVMRLLKETSEKGERIKQSAPAAQKVD